MVVKVKVAAFDFDGCVANTGHNGQSWTGTLFKIKNFAFEMMNFVI